MSLDHDALQEYLALSPRDRVIARLNGAAELIAAANYEVAASDIEKTVKPVTAPKAVLKKKARQVERRYTLNKAPRSRIRLYLEKIEEAIAKGDKANATHALEAAKDMAGRGSKPTIAKRDGRNSDPDVRPQKSFKAN